MGIYHARSKYAGVELYASAVVDAIGLLNRCDCAVVNLDDDISLEATVN